MKCEKCGSAELDIVDSRSIEGGVWRRRECRRCWHRFTTYEVSKDDFLKFALWKFSGEMNRETLNRMEAAVLEKLKRHKTAKMVT